MYSFGIWSVVSTVVSAVFGGGIVWIINIKAQKRKAKAEAEITEANADGIELNNVQVAIKIWREMAEKLSDEVNAQMQKSEQLRIELNKLSKEVARLTTINTKILHLLDEINPKNLEQKILEMKEIIKEG